MPTYDYSCRKCGHTFEVFEGISAKPRKPCPKCKKGIAHRMIGAGAGLMFKGSGFYITENRGSDYKAKASAESASSKEKAPAESSSPKAKAAPESASPRSESSAGGKEAKDCACAPKKAKKGTKA